MKKSVFFVLIIIAGNLVAQNECFNNCMERLAIEQALLKSKKINSIDSFLVVNGNIIRNLKGCQFPETELNKLDSGKISINSFKGKLVFVNFWFSSCTPCVAEIPSINKLIDEYKNKNVAFLAISSDDRKRILSFLKEEEKFNAIQTYLDEISQGKYFCAIGGYPMTMILDKQGKVIDVWTGGKADKTNQVGFYNKVKALIDANL